MRKIDVVRHRKIEIVGLGGEPKGKKICGNMVKKFKQYVMRELYFDIDVKKMTKKGGKMTKVYTE